MIMRSSRIPLAILLASNLAATGLVAQTLVGDGTVPCGGTYVVVPGDTLSVLSQRAYGTSRFYTSILDANAALLGGRADRLGVGMSIAIPCLDASGQVVTSTVDIQSAINAEGPLTDKQLEALFGPVALFPDPVLTPILLSVTMPLDVVKAGRFVEDSAGLSAQERAAAASDQNWDPALRELAAGYPELVTRMSDHIDWTEQAGEAVLVQTDDVLDTIQRLRSKAMDNGYLVDNEAQTIQVTNNTINIAPATPGVVYVPTYDPQVIYTTPVSTMPAYYYDDDFYRYNNNWNDALVGGAIFLGSAVILDEIFDDNDWNDIGGWGGDDVSIDWDRGDINIERGDVTIGGGDRVNVSGGDRITIGGDRTDITNIDRTNIGNGDRTTIDRTNIGNGDRTNIANGDRRDIDRTIRNASDDASREAARQRIESRQATGGDVARLPATLPADRTPRAETRPTAGTLDRPTTGTRDRPSDRQVPATRPATTHRDTPVSRPTQTQRPAAQSTQRTRTPAHHDNVFSPSSRSVSPQAIERGRQSTRNLQGTR